VYVERNPVRAGLVRRATEYVWSSAAAHATEDEGRGLLDLSRWRERFSGEEWTRLLEDSEAGPEFGGQIQLSTRTGRPCCDANDLRRFEEKIGRLLGARPVGRHRKLALMEERQEVFGF